MTKQECAKRVYEQILAANEGFTGALTFRLDFNCGAVRGAKKTVEEAVK